MVQSIQGVLPEPRIGWTAEEQDMVLRHRRRCVATADIMEGDRLSLGFNYGVFRTKTDDTKGLSGFSSSGISGNIAVKALSPGEGIGPNDTR